MCVHANGIKSHHFSTDTHLMNWKALLRCSPLKSRTACSSDGVKSMRVMRCSARKLASCGGSYITSSGMMYNDTPVMRTACQGSREECYAGHKVRYNGLHQHLTSVPKHRRNFVRTEMERMIFWDVRAHWCFRGMYCHPHQGQKVSQAREQQEAGSKQSLNTGGLIPHYTTL